MAVAEQHLDHDDGARERLGRRFRASAGRATSRVAELVIVLVLITLGTSYMTSLIHGDAATAILGPGHAPEQYVELSHKLGLDQPFFHRYVSWLSHAVRGDLGTSVVPPGGTVTSRIMAALPVSAELAAFGIIIALGIAIPLALWSANRPDGRADRMLSGVTFGLVSLPSFLAGLLLILMFVQLWPILPRAQWSRLTGASGLWQNVRHAIMPSLVVAIPQVPIFARVLRADLIETMGQDFILAARARGVSPRRVLMYHALRPSSFSLVTLAGVSVGQVIGSTVIAEYLFGLPGLGTLIVNAATLKDLPLLQGAVVIVAVAYVLANAIVDVLYSRIDPRLRRREVAL